MGGKSRWVRVRAKEGSLATPERFEECRGPSGHVQAPREVPVCSQRVCVRRQARESVPWNDRDGNLM